MSACVALKVGWSMRLIGSSDDRIVAVSTLRAWRREATTVRLAPIVVEGEERVVAHLLLSKRQSRRPEHLDSTFRIEVPF